MCVSDQVILPTAPSEPLVKLRAEGRIRPKASEPRASGPCPSPRSLSAPSFAHCAVLTQSVV